MFSAADLLGRSAELIHDRFGYEHVLIFLLDETGRMAVLSEAAGPSGEALKAIGLRAAVGSESVIGWVTENRQARVVGHTGSETLDAPSGLLAGTRSEATLPLRVGDRLIGALDVHSRAPNAFSAASVEVLQALADQISVALENGRLFARQERVAQLEQRVAGLTARIHSSLTLDAILENAATELGHVFGASKVVVRLKPEAESLLAGPAAAPAVTPAAPLPAGKPGNGNGNGHALEPNGSNRPAADPTS